MDAKANNCKQKRIKSLPISKIREIKDRLPVGGNKRIAEETGLSEGYVSQVLRGDRWNKAVMVKAKEIIEEHEAEMEELLDF